jgi:hypothetical protein
MGRHQQIGSSPKKKKPKASFHTLPTTKRGLQHKDVTGSKVSVTIGGSELSNEFLQQRKIENANGRLATAVLMVLRGMWSWDGWAQAVQLELTARSVPKGDSGDLSRRQGVQVVNQFEGTLDETRSAVTSHRTGQQTTHKKKGWRHEVIQGT